MHTRFFCHSKASSEEKEKKSTCDANIHTFFIPYYASAHAIMAIFLYKFWVSMQGLLSKFDKCVAWPNVYVNTHVHTYHISTRIHTYTHAYMSSQLQHAIRAYIAYIHTHIHTHIHTCCSFNVLFGLLWSLISILR